MKKLLIRFIRFYQRRISPAYPRRCRYEPTCSEYAAQAIGKYGALKGGALAYEGYAAAIRFPKGTTTILCRNGQIRKSETAAPAGDAGQSRLCMGEHMNEET